MGEEILRVWHIPQVPGDPFYISVKNIDEAILVLNALADYDIFQFNNKIKPDYCNAQGLEECWVGEWSEYYNEDGEDINEILIKRGDKQCPF